MVARFSLRKMVLLLLLQPIIVVVLVCQSDTPYGAVLGVAVAAAVDTIPSQQLSSIAAVVCVGCHFLFVFKR